MKTLELESKDILIIDPCYIKRVHFDGEDRFDALKCVKTLHDGDDGEFIVCAGGWSIGEIGVDSGRIWVLQAEFGCTVDVDSGLSGEVHIKFGELVEHGQAEKFIEKLAVAE